MKTGRFIYCFILSLLSAITVSAQNDLRFEYEYSDVFGRTVDTEVLLTSPSNEVLSVFSDTVNTFSGKQEGLLKEKGNYNLSIRVAGHFFSADTLNYSFRLNGNETNVDIKVHFYNDPNPYPRIWDNPEKQLSVPEVYIFMTKYYERQSGLLIEPADIEPSGHYDYYEKPFFRLTNHTQDTLYGEYLPGHFIGTLICGENRQEWTKDRFGEIDFGFAEVPPLPPGYSTIAMVSPADVKKSPAGDCRYELIYSTRRNPSGFILYRNESSVVWRTQEKEYYRLLYDFSTESDKADKVQ